MPLRRLWYIYVVTAAQARVFLGKGSTGMRKGIVFAGVVIGALAANVASAQQNPWMVRAGGHYLSAKDNSGHLTLDDNKLFVDVDDSAMFTFSASYLFNEHWAVELFGSGPFESDIKVDGAGKASTKYVMPMVSWLYYWNTGGRVRPYLGAGINFAIFMDESPSDLDLNEAIGPAAVGGVDFSLSERWFLSLDLRWVDMDTETKVNGDRVGEISFDPFLVGAMVGYRFGGGRSAQTETAAPPPSPPPSPVVAAPTPCADSDSDGVCDVDDKCPSTPAGDTVDQFGCSLVSRLMLFFDFDSAELRPESIRELERVVDFMNQLSVATALIEGHTDSIGSDAYNLGLSERRAKSVYDYLVSRGISPGRLQALGQGEAHPIADNGTDMGRQQNRRVMLIRTDSGA